MPTGWSCKPCILINPSQSFTNLSTPSRSDPNLTGPLCECGNICGGNSGNLRTDDLPEGGRFLPKPYGPEEIVGTLRELVGA
jgi:hypothetical protein